MVGWEGGGPQSPGAAPPAADTPSAAALLAAGDSLQRTLGMLSASLDAAVFGDVWRAVALGINRAFFDELALEALFSPEVPLLLFVCWLVGCCGVVREEEGGVLF